MKQEIAIKWVKALRSGRYKQGQGMLETDDGRYCCLGVLCKITRTKFVKDGSIVPEAARKKFAMKSCWGQLAGSSLVEENDYGKSFKEIADIIEVCWADL